MSAHKGTEPWNKGKHHTQKTKNLMKEVSKEGFKNGRQIWNKGLTKNIDLRLVEMGRKVSLANRGRVSSFLGRQHNQMTIDRMAEKAVKRWSDPELRKTQSNMQKELWKDPEHVRKVMHRRILSGPEQIFINLCKEFRFVGNGELVIGGKNPDFVCINDDHKLVEIWGDFFHKGQNPQDRIDFFADRGYDCLVIWEHELKYLNKVVLRVQNFTESEI